MLWFDISTFRVNNYRSSSKNTLRYQSHTPVVLALVKTQKKIYGLIQTNFLLLLQITKLILFFKQQFAS